MIVILPILAALSAVALDSDTHYECAEKTPSRVVATVGMTLCIARPAEIDRVTVEGALVTVVEKGGPSDHEGLKAGDLAYKISDVMITTAEAASERLDGLRVEGDTVVNFMRNGRPYLVHLRR